jgi:hypothetical protein
MNGRPGKLGLNKGPPLRSNSLSGINEESSSNLSKRRQLEEGGLANAKAG